MSDICTSSGLREYINKYHLMETKVLETACPFFFFFRSRYSSVTWFFRHHPCLAKIYVYYLSVHHEDNNTIEEHH